MITPEQRKKLEEEAVAYWQDDLAKFFPTSKGPTGSEKIMFLAGAEALARIQDEDSCFDESDFIGRNPFEDTRLEEERKWRPLVEEMLSCLSELVDLTEATRSGEYKPDSFTVQSSRTVIARASALLGEKK